MFELFSIEVEEGIKVHDFLEANPDYGKNGSKAGKRKSRKRGAAKEEEEKMKLDRLLEQ